jgi:hypothetical protein
VSRHVPNPTLVELAAREHDKTERARELAAQARLDARLAQLGLYRPPRKTQAVWRADRERELDHWLRPRVPDR